MSVISAWVVRITPAHAGKRVIDIRIEGFWEDHPRTRGEKAVIQFVIELVIGSPPHTRGKVRKFLLILLSLRITPAHAGKSRADS